MYKVCLAGTSTPVEGTNSFSTLAEAEEYLKDKQIYYSDNDPDRPSPDGSKFVILPFDMI